MHGMDLTPGKISYYGFVVAVLKDTTADLHIVKRPISTAAILRELCRIFSVKISELQLFSGILWVRAESLQMRLHMALRMVSYASCHRIFIT